MAADHFRTGHLQTGGARIYHEVRGSGPVLVFVPGGGVDATHFETIASLLADTYTTVTYDRRGYFRSSLSSDDRSPSTISRHTNDLAALIESLGAGPAAVWGGSLGAFIAMDLLSRRPELLTTALVHEPPLFSVLEGGGPPPLPRDLSHPRAAMEEHARQTLGDNFDRLTPQQRERVIANGEAFFGTDAPGVIASLPTPGTLASALASSTVTVHVLACPGDPAPPLRRTSRWVADQAGTTLIDLPGGHMPYAVEPEATAQILRNTIQHTTATRSRP
ncbi:MULTISPECIES: alpha/beta fold hydrolase [unclassified Nonomuraea]|uniref:alpha/beta fold hydrolase n=1 Tax=unclassified Nonomuraea TaxID=2593643 RepID=UPI001376754C|nr:MULTISPECIES: alpha/beta hydrolase [unclassified Nonomuraea]NBE93306.1 alpha/beta fold hydrolase [Nonomuraea sp. K271]